MATLKKALKLKRDTLRHAEYYDLTATFDKLYADSKSGESFTNLVEIISSRDNILLAYRELKRNKGSMTAGTDKLTIRDIEKIPTEDFVRTIQKKLDWYTPRPVKRVEIPKDNGKTRPLGIPSIWDRIVQQCMILAQPSIKSLEQTLDIKRRISETAYHNTKLLLRLYRKVNWRLENRLDELDMECFEAGNGKLNTALDELSGILGESETEKLENRALDLLHSRHIISMMEKAVMMVKDYPENGELYYRILDMVYLTRLPLDEDVILTELDRSRSTYFKLKKEAIETLGVILWGFLIPAYRNDENDWGSVGLVPDLLRTQDG